MQPIDLKEVNGYGAIKDLVSEKEEIKCSNIIKQYKRWLSLIMLQNNIIQESKLFTNSWSQGFHLVKEYVRGSGNVREIRDFFGKSQGRKFLSMQFFNVSKKIICMQICVKLNCIWQSVLYMMLLFASSVKMI